MTRELAKKILKQYAQRAYCGEIMTPNPEEIEALFEGVKALERLERLNAPEVNMPQYDRYKQEQEPDPPKTWIKASEINAKITEVVNTAVKEAMKREHDKKLLEVIREIVEAEYFRELVNCLVFAAEKRRESAKDDI